MVIVNQQLVNYIKDLKKKGYDDNSIRASLTTSGYPENEINSAFAYSKRKSKKRLKKSYIFAFAGGLIAVLVLSFIFFYSVRVPVKESSVRPFEEVENTLPVAEDGAANIFQAPAQESLNENESISPDERPVVSERAQTQEELSEFDALPGNNPVQKLEYIESLASTSPNIAAGKCELFSNEYDANNCYKNLARVLKNPNLCKKMSQLEATDSCLLSVASNKAVCDSISDTIIKTACESRFKTIPSIDSVPDEYRISPTIQSCDDLQDKDLVETCKYVQLDIERQQESNLT